MAGNARRPGAIRKTARKGPSVGTGGHRRRGLEGRGPTPKAEDRVHHKAHKRGDPANPGAGTGAAGGPDRSGGQARSGGAARSGGRAPRAASQPATSSSGRRTRAGGDVVVGRNAVVEALAAGVPATALYLAPRGEADDRITAALRVAQESGIPILESTRPDLDRLSGGAIHQGILATLAPFEYVDPADLHDPLAPGVPLVVALDGVNDPRNLGAVIRSVAAFGGHGVVIPQRRSVDVTAGTWKASAGTVARVPVAKATNLTRALEDFRRAGFFVVGLDADGELPLPELSLAGEPLVLVVGSEGQGLSRLVRATCDCVVSIPMAGRVESLNVGVAAGVALYEVARQRAAAAR